MLLISGYEAGKEVKGVLKGCKGMGVVQLVDVATFCIWGTITPCTVTIILHML